MPRNDGILYSGMAAKSRAELAHERTLRQREKLEKKSSLLPMADIVIQELEKEKTNTKLELLRLIGPSTSDTDVKSLIVSLNLYDQSMSGLAGRLKNILRAKAPESTDE